MNTSKFKCPLYTTELSHVSLFLIKSRKKQQLTRKKINSLFSTTIQVPGHKRNHDACALCSPLNSSRDWSDTSRYSSMLEVPSGFTSPHNLVSQRRRSKSGFRIEGSDGESKSSVVRWQRLMTNRKSTQTLSEGK